VSHTSLRNTFAILLALILLTGCGDKIHKQQSYVFGTLVEVTIYGEPEDKARRVTDQVLKDFDVMHQRLHAWQPGALEQVNGMLAQARPGAPARAPLTPQLSSILRDAARLSALSEGLFNPAIGNLVRLWGFHSDTFEPRLPDTKQIEVLTKAMPGMADLRFDGDLLIASNSAARLDLGGYAKGYALDRAAAYLKSQGVGNALINIGGNVMALGSKGGQPFFVTEGRRVTVITIAVGGL
jgi:thiamine biosynthesis lipoprotein